MSESHNRTMRLSETARVEAFSDGVFAIIITLLVLDVLSVVLSLLLSLFFRR